MATNPRIGKLANSASRSGATGDIHHLRSWANGKGIRLEGRGRPPKDLIARYERETGRKYVSGKVLSKPVSSDTSPRKKIYRPNCVVHKVEMVFDTNDNFFKCPRKDCVIKALPKAEANKPIVGTGVIKFLSENGKTYLTADNGVRMDISGYLRDGVGMESSFGQPLMAEFTLRLEVRE